MSASPTSASQYAAWQGSTLPETEEIRDDVFAISIPMTGNPLRYSYCYVLLDGADALLVDPGWPTDESWAALRAGLSRIGSDVSSVKAVLVTHAHHDHYGLVPRVLDASGGWVGLGAADIRDVVPHDADFAAILERRRSWLMREGGAAREDAERNAGEVEAIEFAAVTRLPDRPLRSGEVLRHGRFEIEVVATPGHSPGHLVFHERRERLLFSGDHVLPRITPNVSTFAGHRGTALADYLTSLERVGALDVGEVLPGHEYRFSGMAERLGQLRDHHERRLDEVLVALDGEKTAAWALSRELSWSRSWERLSPFSRRAALGETLAHLHVLAGRGLVQLEDSDGVWMWRAAGADERAVAAGR